MFEDRAQAGQKLAEKLKELSLDPQESIILALPRGGVVVANKVAKILKLPLDIIVTRKIGHPHNPEYAIGAVSSHKMVLNPHEKVPPGYLKKEIQKERQEIQRRLKDYRGNQSSLVLKEKQVIIVDDGLATCLTMQAAIYEVKFHQPKKIFLAVPVAPPETVDKLKPLVSNIIVLKKEPNFFAVGQFYRIFDQTTDFEVKDLLGRR